MEGPPPGPRFCSFTIPFRTQNTLCRTNVGPFWLILGPFGGLCEVSWRSRERKIQHQPKTGELKGYVGPMLGRFGRHSWDDNPGRTHFEDGLGWFIVLIRCNI